MRHPYHLIEPSPWPLLISFNLLFLLLDFVGYFTGYLYSLNSFIFTLLLILVILSYWFYDIITESLYLGFHSIKVSRGLILAFILFMLTEVMLFISLFWGYFNSALNPTNLIWPPIGIDLVNPWSIPLLNTFLLIYSGIAATWGHHSFLAGNRTSALYGLGIGILLGYSFIVLQAFEYFNSTFDISDSSYGTTFFMLTGFHGFHVIVGALFLTVVWIRLFNYHTPTITFDLSLLYYHLVDAIWIALFVLIYYLAY